ncbi:MAG: flagellar hook-basal body complex protein FliE [Planctomycetota bacterium]|nr:flagellar hook-basal body complex protein FliE [Planctomycetota bacterium]
MSDPLGFISGGIDRTRHMHPQARPDVAGDAPGKSFKDVLLDSLDEANRLQQEATRAVEDLQTGERQDVENVLLATTKADNAFRMLQAVRNRVMEAYDELKQMRT